MTPEHFVLAAFLLFVAYLVAHASGLLCRLRGHWWLYGTSIEEDVHGRDCGRCGRRERWWSQWFLSRFPSFEDDRPDDMKAAGRWRNERE